MANYYLDMLLINCYYDKHRKCQYLGGNRNVYVRTTDLQDDKVVSMCDFVQSADRVNYSIHHVQRTALGHSLICYPQLTPYEITSWYRNYQCSNHFPWRCHPGVVDMRCLDFQWLSRAFLKSH